MRKISDQGLSILKGFEALSLKTYSDVKGVLTIGWGHTGPDVHDGMRITEEQAEDLLRADLVTAETYVERDVRVPLNQNEFDALVCFVFNVGVTAFRQSTVLKRLNIGDRQGAADHLLDWDMSGGRVIQGLTNRRQAERALFLARSE